MIVLDTQIVIWITTGGTRLSGPAANRIREASRSGEETSIASSTLWEIAMTYSKGGLYVPGTLGEYLSVIEKTFTILPITGRVAVRSQLFSDRYPKDLTDGIIGATTVVHGAKLITADRKISDAGEVGCVW